MVVHVHLHTSLQFLTGLSRTSQVSLELPPGARVADAIAAVGIPYPTAALILVVNQKVVDLTDTLLAGDELHLIPAMSGGCAAP